MWLFRSGLVLFAYTGINIYTGIKVLGLLKCLLPSVKAYIFWPFYIIICYSYIIIFLLRMDRVQPLRQIAVFSLPAIVYFFMGLLFFDLLRLILRFAAKIPLSPGFPAAGTGIALGLALLAMVYASFHARNIGTAHYSIALNKAGVSPSGLSQAGGGNPGTSAGAESRGSPPEAGLRIVLVSDLHIGTTVNRKWVAKIVDAANAAKPDLICLAGDIFDNNIETIPDLEGIAAELQRFEAALGVYACQGNHDVDRLSLRSGGTTNHIQDFLKTVNIAFLLDEVELVAGRFYLAGRRDARPIGMGSARKSAAELVIGLDTSKPLIIMDHQPTDFPRLEAAGADLILSGHTHGGQFFPGNIATSRIFKEAGAVHYGYWRGQSAQAVVSSGAGVWGPPVRIFTKSEVAVLDIILGADN